MTTAFFSPQNPKFILLLLAAGAFVVTRRGFAQTPRTVGGASTPQAAAMRYTISTGTAQAQGVGLGPRVDALTTIVGLGSKVLNTFSPNRVAAGPWGDYYPGHLGTGVSAEADGDIGVGAAQAFYQSHMSDFQAPIPVITDSMADAALLEGMSEY